MLGPDAARIDALYRAISSLLHEVRLPLLSALALDVHPWHGHIGLCARGRHLSRSRYGPFA